MGRHAAVGRTAVRTVGTGPRVVTTPRAEGHDEPRGRLFDELETEQAIVLLERLTAARAQRRRILELA